jgi:hypothetical protein
MKKLLALKNKKRMNKEMKDVTIATWFLKPCRWKTRKLIRYTNPYKALHCSECSKSPKYAIRSDYCQNCGAKMAEGEAQE